MIATFRYIQLVSLSKIPANSASSAFRRVLPDRLAFVVAGPAAPRPPRLASSLAEPHLVESASRVLVPTSSSRTDTNEPERFEQDWPIPMFEPLKFNTEGNRAKPVRTATYRKSNPRKFFGLGLDAGTLASIESALCPTSITLDSALDDLPATTIARPRTRTQRSELSTTHCCAISATRSVQDRRQAQPSEDVYAANRGINS
jgi:hypothetical protein